MANFEIDIEETVNPLSKSRRSSHRESGMPAKPQQPNAYDDGEVELPEEDSPRDRENKLSKERSITQTAETGDSAHPRMSGGKHSITMQIETEDVVTVLPI